ncbi:hypothetical protein SAMN05216388_10436 [Halorientalis persicus]|uniref:Uncharacterized protein n=1 Tax=Halorientalis persicus TaxID=1367881 RepID=A0A1H8VVZ2_9EURY|nr:hypothetical protein [Halorientalis persicus]SEP19566.1 hypothetical protein SAMN05216388_10436 [Halorientalis persicus]
MFLQDHDEYEQGLFRRLILDEKLFTTEPDSIWSHVWERFQPAKGYPVCVYLDGYEQLVRTKEHSATASAVFEAVCERLVADPDSASPPVLFGCTKNEDTPSPHLEMFTS